MLGSKLMFLYNNILVFVKIFSTNSSLINSFFIIYFILFSTSFIFLSTVPSPSIQFP